MKIIFSFLCEIVINVTMNIFHVPCNTDKQLCHVNAYLKDKLIGPKIHTCSFLQENFKLFSKAEAWFLPPGTSVGDSIDPPLSNNWNYQTSNCFDKLM